MVAESKLVTPRELTRRLDTLLESRCASTAESDLVRAVPLAFPVISAVFEVKERQTVEGGLIERYVVEAVQKFGPISAAEIEAMLGLEEEIVRRILQEAITLGQPIDLIKSRYTAKHDVDLAGFSCEATHERRFIFNGITGAVLPIAYRSVADAERLFPSEDPFAIRDMDGQPTPLRAFLRHAIFEEKSGLMRALGPESRAARVALGLPHEMVDVGEQKYTQREMLWIPAFLLVTTERGVEVIGMHGDGVTLLDSSDASLNWLNKACEPRRISSLTHGSGIEALQKEVGAAFPGVTLETADGVNRVRLMGDEQAWDLARFIDHAPEVAWLAAALRQGYWWGVFDGDLVFLMPGCPPAARTLCLLRAIEELYRVRNRHPASAEERESRDDWWRQHVKRFYSRLGEGLDETDLPLSELDACVDLYPDTGLQDWYEEWE